jgi:hypothetical protein
VPRNYTVTVENVTVTNAGGDADLVELDAATDKPIELYGIMLYTTSELQEAQEEWLRCKVIRGHTTTGNGTTATPRPLSPVDTAAGFVAETFSTTIASAGTGVDLAAFAFNVRAGYEILLPEGSGYWTSGADLLVVRLMAAPTDDVSMNMTFFVREYP